MRKVLVLVSAVLFAGSAFAAGGRTENSQRQEVRKAPVQVAAVDKTGARRATAASHAAILSVGDSRLDNYRLERESCCGPN